VTIVFKNYRDRQDAHDNNLNAVRMDRDNLAVRLRDQIYLNLEDFKCLEMVRNAWEEYVDTENAFPMIEAMKKANEILQRDTNV